jgi:hypothetical protein
MILSDVFERFSQDSPLSVMAQGVMENAMNPQILDQLFEDVAQTRLSDFYRRPRLPASKVSCAEASAGFAQVRGAEISAHTGLFTDNSLIVAWFRVARKEGRKPPVAILSTPCLEKSPKV